MSKIFAFYHIVFCTKERRMTIPLSLCEDVYRFIWKEVTTLDCKLIRIGGIQNHVHMLIGLHPSVALADLMKNVKAKSSGWMRSDNRFRDFIGWANDYYACTVSPDDKDAVVEYIKGQQTHHLGRNIDDELSVLYRIAGLEYNDRDLR